MTLRHLLLATLMAAPLPAADKTLIAYFLPMPIQGQLTNDIWGAPNVLPRDPAGALVPGSLQSPDMPDRSGGKRPYDS